MKLSNTVMFGVAVPVIILMLFIGIAVTLLLQSTGKELMADVRMQQEQAISNLLKGQVEVALTIIEKAYADADPGIPLADVQADVLRRIGELRFGEGNLSYFWVHHFDPEDVTKTTMLMHPVISGIDGTDISDYYAMERFDSILFEGTVYNTDDPVVQHIRDTNLFVEMNEVCRESGGGMILYYWPKPIAGGATVEGRQKMSYVGLFEPWNWVVGTGEHIDYIDGIILAAQCKTEARQRSIWLVVAAGLFLALLIGFAISYWVGRKLSRLYSELAEHALRNEEISSQLKQQNDELEQALAEVKTLSGLLPICSFCKHIRDDQGYWNQMESYISHRSEAQFSHSICPKCAKEHYPDLDL